MKLRTKTLLAIGVTLLGLVGVLYAASSSILLGSLKRAEEQNTRQAVKVVLSSFEQVQQDFSDRFSDWSAWDDTYTFIQDGNQQYIQSNLIPEQFSNLKINLALFINSSNQIVFGTGFDLKTKQQIPISDAIKSYISPQNLLLSRTKGEPLKGILLLKEGAIIITSQPILTSHKTGPSKGTLILGRYLDIDAIRKFSNRTYLTVYAINDPKLPPDFLEAQTKLSEEKPIFVRVLDEKNIAGYTFINDIYGKPAIMLRADITRSIYQQSQSALRYLVVALVMLGLVFGCMTLLLLERLVLSRLAKLSIGVRRVGASGDLSLRLYSRGTDELASLAGTINGMLEALEVSQQQRLEGEKRHRAIVEQASEGILILDADTKQVVDANSAIQQLLGYEPVEILEQTIYDLITTEPEVVNSNIELIRTKKHLFLGERQYRRKDGSLVEVEVSISLISYGGRQLVCTIVRDMTESKRSQAALKQAEDKYRQIFEHASEGIFQSTYEGQFISANPALAKIFGYSSPEELIINITDIEKQVYVDPRRRSRFISTIERKNSIYRFISQVYRQDGSIIWISENARAVRDLNGKLLYYEGTLEDITYRKVAEEALRYQQERTERLLLNILPEPIAVRLKMEESNIADSFADVSVLFADLVDFTKMCADIPPVELVKLLNQIFSAFDQLAEQHGLEKIKTIGDAYMVVGGLPTPRDDHAEAIADMALDMLEEIARFRGEQGQPFSIRIGINIGPVVAGVIGIKKFIYDLWGDTVNTASRMESQGLEGCIQVTATTYELLKDKYYFEKRGVIQVKGKGEMTTYFLTGKKAWVVNNTYV